jgi:hypothetical protein
MIPLKQPNEWSCLPTACAMVLDCTVQDIFDLVGHDGSEIIAPELPSPANRRGVSYQEIVDVGYARGFSLGGIEAAPERIVDVQRALQGFPGIPIYKQEVAEYRFQTHLNNASGIVIGDGVKYPHAVAWDHREQMFYDPKDGRAYEDLPDFVATLFWRFDRIKSV